ncbi:hypothetical protein RVR_4542 [Actinacidiphila reveromycinica]|uniref:Uncharacterized protein n=1 Tax=Actinacidiphila reveromycinica TaxID=659352 RepID=A0A7U3UTC3_9ACTN|nr:hypothetical protein [Streptomyces sp. SN-593]BBA98384.1 hypothetical protein RVR_4542 [Streptomyces sp. SN-593]
MNRDWITGWCWRCEATDVLVLWVGPVHSAEAGEAPLYYCLPCIRRLEELIAAHHRA